MSREATATASAAVSPATYRATTLRVSGAETSTWRSRSLSEAASSMRRSTANSSQTMAVVLRHVTRDVTAMCGVGPGRCGA